MVNLLLTYNTEVDFTDTEGNSALHIACQDEALDVARCLVQHGADISRKNKEEKTPLDYLKPGASKTLLNIHQQSVIPR